VDNPFVTGILLAIPLGLIPAFIAHNKGYSFFVWWLFGWALFIVALPCALIMTHNTDVFKLCPRCGSWVGREMQACRFCGSELIDPLANQQRIFLQGEEDASGTQARIGVPPQQQATRHGWTASEVVAVAVGILVLLLLIGGLASQMLRGPIASFTQPVVSMSEFNEIQNGMSYRQVVEIIGSEGNLISSNHMDGVPGVMAPIDTVMYQWTNPGGSNMLAMFQNDSLNTKSQFGLR